MAASRRNLREDARDPFQGGGANTENSLNRFPYSTPTAANEDVARTGLTIDRVEDLVIELGQGNEEAMPYRLYTGSSILRKGGILVVRFHDRWVFLEGERLKPVRDAISNKRCGHLRVSSRMERMNGEKSGEPVITALRVVKPKQGGNELASMMEGKSPLDLAGPKH